MSSKNYESKCARLVQEAASVKYTKALEWVRFHETAHPEHMPVETRALRIVEAHDGGQLALGGLK